MTPQWGVADAEIKVPSVENTELKGSLFEAWSMSLLSFSKVSGFLLWATPHWGAADAEIKVPSVENTELKRFLFKTGIYVGTAVHSHTCYACCQGIFSLLISTLPVHSPAFFPKPLPIFSCVGCG